MEPTDTRKKALAQWLVRDCGLQDIALHVMPGDASFRRYFRIVLPTGSYVAMDAPPPENCRPFVAIAKALRKQGLSIPEIIATNLEQGFLLISDFGDVTYLKKLQERNADRLYQRALQALSVLQNCREVTDWSIPAFGREWMWKEWYGFKEWFLEKWLGLSLAESLQKTLEKSFTRIVESAVDQPQVFMHRDFHSANLMVLPNDEVGILDFQDAFIGPVTYDLVSLLRDCYIDWPKERVLAWVFDYQQKLAALQKINREEFLRWVDWMGMQRHLKALFTFARKYVRDHQPQYLNHVPRTLGYLLDVSQHYPEFKVLHDYLKTVVYEEVIAKCER